LQDVVGGQIFYAGEDAVNYLDGHIDKEPNLIERILARKNLAIVVAVGMFLFLFFVTFLLPRKYRADLKVLLKNDRVNTIVSLDQKAEGIYYLDEVGEARLNTEIELMRSPEVLREVVQRSGLADREPSKFATKRIDLAVKHLQENLAIAPVRRSNVIAASYVSHDPKLAANVLRLLRERYIDFHLQLHSAPKAAKVFQQMAEDYRRQRDNAQAELDAFKKQHVIASLPDEKALTLQRISDLGKQWSDAQVEITRSQNQRSKLQDLIGSTPAIVEKERRSMPNQLEMEQLNMTLVGLESKRVEAAARYQPTDRVITDLDEQIRLTREALAKAQATKSEEISTERNTLHVAAQSDFMKLEAELAGLTRQSREIGEQLQSQKKRLADLDGETAAYDNLNRSVTRFTELNQTYEKKASEVAAGELLDERGVANVAIVEDPIVPSLAIFPKRSLLLLVSFLWSVAVGLASALIFDLTAKRVEPPYDLELALDAPVIGLLPDGFKIPVYNETNAAVYKTLQRQSSPVWRLP